MYRTKERTHIDAILPMVISFPNAQQFPLYTVLNHGGTLLRWNDLDTSSRRAHVSILSCPQLQSYAPVNHAPISESENTRKNNNIRTSSVLPRPWVFSAPALC